MACGIKFPVQGTSTLHWECRVLATGLPGKSPALVFRFLLRSGTLETQGLQPPDSVLPLRSQETKLPSPLLAAGSPLPAHTAQQKELRGYQVGAILR